MEKTILGHIDCPHCGEPAGMEIKHDKNQDPFGYCAYCNGGQLRVGGNPGRVRAFIRRYPWAAKPGTAPAPAADPVTAPAPAKIPVTVTEQEPGPKTHHGPVKKRSSFEDALTLLGVKS
jgi:hypothetical protein